MEFISFLKRHKIFKCNTILSNSTFIKYKFDLNPTRTEDLAVGTPATSTIHLDTTNHWFYLIISTVNKMRGGGDGSDVRRLERQQRYKVLNPTTQNNQEEDFSQDYMNIIGMVLSMCAIMLKMKWCAWVALYCSCVSFANTKVNDNSKHIYSSFMLSFSAIAVSYLQNPQPMSPPWATSFSP